ncbi:hypothetical protein HLRTI_000961 [Halorhabdus tiamatea SARL4B]|uniref:Uncharacterized protein n=1 Tax=Halorhabdus tiamatea SARL4B TaxID=1033806 RepID=F7PHP4_9EURY|nr:hypothetical protein [Halorhabdus tiamatea]ERJ06888.1 hypothetical protein HLRTI_000961 [Halorhabdus tiamatea SARL4B]CCQ32408.1 conserved hypothetical protein [Halorhabdus tiamatea SARL4B]
MVVFFANRDNLQSKRLHDRIRNRLDGGLTDVRRRRTEPREAGQYRVVGEGNPRQFLEEPDYSVTAARIEVGFRLRTGDPYEHYWFNWIEPDRDVLVGWHQDDTHDDLGPVHVQVNDGSAVVEHRPARFLDTHPLDVLERRLDALSDLVTAVEWDDGRPVGFDTSVESL